MFFGSLATGLANALYAIMQVDVSYFAFNCWSQFLGPVGVDVCKLLIRQSKRSGLTRHPHWDFRTGAVIGYIYITRMVSSTEVAAASASLQFFKIFGIVIGSSFSTLVYTGVARSHGAPKEQLFADSSEAELLLGLRAAFWYWAALSFLGEYKLGKRLAL